jgi:hypothetical protein
MRRPLLAAPLLAMVACAPEPTTVPGSTQTDPSAEPTTQTEEATAAGKKGLFGLAEGYADVCLYEPPGGDGMGTSWSPQQKQKQAAFNSFIASVPNVGYTRAVINVHNALTMTDPNAGGHCDQVMSTSQGRQALSTILRWAHDARFPPNPLVQASHPLTPIVTLDTCPPPTTTRAQYYSEVKSVVTALMPYVQHFTSVNEPDGPTIHQDLWGCSGSFTALEAAEYWETAALAVKDACGDKEKCVVIPGELASVRPKTSYPQWYVKHVRKLAKGHPTAHLLEHDTWSMHDYHDVSRNTYEDSEAYASLVGGGAHIWITESGASLVESISNGVPVGLKPISGSPCLQSKAGEVFLGLQNTVRGGPHTGAVTLVLYYEIEAVAQAVGFDSALMDWNGNLRPVACAITKAWSSPLWPMSCANPGASELTGYGVAPVGSSGCP